VQRVLVAEFWAPYETDESDESALMIEQFESMLAGMCICQQEGSGDDQDICVVFLLLVSNVEKRWFQSAPEEDYERTGGEYSRGAG
jgi:hypothetical protein